LASSDFDTFKDNVGQFKQNISFVSKCFFCSNFFPNKEKSSQTCEQTSQSFLLGVMKANIDGLHNLRFWSKLCTLVLKAAQT
jgi:hypothetical protein